MGSVAVLIADLFEDVEYTQPAAALKKAGARFVDEEVVEDGNLVTNRHPGDIPVFIRKMLSKLDQ